MRTMVSVMVAALMVVGVVAGFNGWDNSKSYGENVESIFMAKEMNVPYEINNSSVNWTMGDKPIRAVDGTPIGAGETEQEQIDAKNAAFLDRKDPYPQNVSDVKPVRKIDGAWNTPTEQEMVDKNTEEFLNR